MRLFVMLIIMCVVFIGSVFAADTIKLKSGKEVVGNIIERSDSFLKVETKGLKLMYFFSDIDSVNGQKSGEVVVADNNNVVGSGAKLGNLTEEDVSRNKMLALTSAKIEREKAEKSLSDFKVKIINVLIVGIVIYFFSSFCLFTIAKKTEKGKPFFAWIPIANYFLMCDIGEVRYYFLWILLAGILPIVGSLCILGLMGYLWYKIALTMNKPGWIGALACIPLFGLVAIGYLAFKD